MNDHLMTQRKLNGRSAESSQSIFPPLSQNTEVHVTASPAQTTEAEADIQRSAEQTSEQGSKVSQPAFFGHDFSRIPLLPHLTVSQPDEPSEQEADRVAEQVMRMPNSRNTPPVQRFPGHDFSKVSVLPQTQSNAIPLFPPDIHRKNFSQFPVDPKVESGVTAAHLATVTTPLIQREALSEDEADVETESLTEAAEAQQETPPEAELPTVAVEPQEMKPEAGGEEVAPEPEPEQVAVPEESTPAASDTEADLPMAAEPQEMEPEAGGEDAAVEPPMVTPEPPEAEEEVVQRKPALSQSTQNSSAETGNGIEQTLTQSKGGGSPLSDDVRAFMEPRFGAEFSQVRVHTDGTRAFRAAWYDLS